MWNAGAQSRIGGAQAAEYSLFQKFDIGFLDQFASKIIQAMCFSALRRTIKNDCLQTHFLELLI